MKESEGSVKSDFQVKMELYSSSQSAYKSKSNTVTSYSSSSKHGQYRVCTTHLALFLTLTLMLSLTIPVSAMPRGLLCDSRTRCLHNGVLRLPDTPFGFCRCICRGNYVGPRCQFNRRIRRVNRLKRLVKLRNDFEEYLRKRSRTTSR